MATNVARFTILAALVTLPAACKKSEDGAETSIQGASAAPSSSAAPPLASARPDSLRSSRVGRWHERPERLLVVALMQLTLTDTQKAKLEALEKRGEVKPRTFAEDRDFRSALADSAKAGKVDEAKLQRHVETIMETVKQLQEETAKLMNELHATLDPPQRKALVAAVRKELETRHARRKQIGMPEKRKSAEERDKLQAERMTRELGLDPKQAKQMEAIQMKSGDSHVNPDVDLIREEAEKHLRELATAFEKDTFDAGKLAFVTKAPEVARARAKRELERLKVLLPILTPEQRAKFGEFATRGLAPRPQSRPLPVSAASAGTAL